MKYDGPLELLKQNATDVAKHMRVLAHRDRLIMLCRMSDGEVSVGELVELTGLSQSAVSQHLAMLREAGAVESRAQAQTRLYHVADKQMEKIIGALCIAFAPTNGDEAA
ncbi:ArsR/SmtB family transcription factor [Stakelama marina]|uniref:Helix-turn-helix transcriptional regulator n=1 Tax=Stakelama marina TaxID=2826939 RepID=A0A8T4IBS7_9SPHN|nr:metalloregulator ArsR/SmtB family transcription factor [Stakelama marina]MBR0551284.1 helix-turn-helix transcriptional regulator [Stakelama marina]